MRSVCCSRSQMPVAVTKRSFVKITVKLFVSKLVLGLFLHLRSGPVCFALYNLPTFLGVKVVAKCLAKSSADEMQEAAQMLLESMYHGNTKYQSQLYKGLIALLTCSAPKVQQRVLHTLHTVQVNTQSLMKFNEIRYFLMGTICKIEKEMQSFSRPPVS